MATTNTADGATVIGESMRIRGNLSGDEDLHVLGRVEGRVELDRTLIVAKSGIVKAEVSVRNAIISGIVVGDVAASESVELTKDGRMVGDIHAPRVIIVDGASFRGNVDMGDIENMPSRPPRSERRAPTPAPARRPEPRVEARTTSDADKKAAETKTEVKKVEPERTEVAPARTTITVPPAKPSTPPFLEPPKAKALPKKQKHRVVVKRK